MSEQRDDEVEALLNAAKRLNMPGTVSPDDLGYSIESSAEFVARMRESDAQSSRRKRRIYWSVTAGLAASTAIVAGLFALPQGSDTAYAATPPILSYEYAQAAEVAYAPGRPASDTLLRLSRTARNHATTGIGPVQRVTTASWDAQIDADASKPNARVVANTRTTWLRPDGSQVNLDRAGEVVTATGELRPTSETGKVARETLPRGTFDAGRVSSLGGTAETVQARLLARAECDTSKPREITPCLYREIVDAYTNYVVPGPTASAFWAILAQRNDVRTLGTVTDRSGRAGIGIAFPVDPDNDLRSIIIIDRTTGQLMGRETLLTRDDAALGVEAPAIYSFSAILEVGLTKRTGPS